MRHAITQAGIAAPGWYGDACHGTSSNWCRKLLQHRLFTASGGQQALEEFAVMHQRYAEVFGGCSLATGPLLFET